MLTFAPVTICRASTIRTMFYHFGEDSVKFEILLDRLNDSLAVIGIRFASPKCKILLQE